MMNSGVYDGLPSRDGGDRIVADLAAKGLGAMTVQYRLRDWIISRQRYWGAPIPMVHCPDCGEVPVPLADLPVELPEVVDYRPQGKSPLASAEEWMNVPCPTCGCEARRDPDTMDTFVCSSWYYLRFQDPGREDAPFDRERLAPWMPVAMYIGGADHAYGHLIYSRFVNMVLHDLGYVPSEEPFAVLRHQGMITLDGEKMSKSKGNTIVPADYLERFGTDTLRTYLMFGFGFAEGGDWTDESIEGVWRYLNRVWRLVTKVMAGEPPAGDVGDDAPPIPAEERDERWRRLRVVMHNSIKGCTQDLERVQFNTAVSRLMELTNALYAYAGRNAVDADDEHLCEALRNLIVMLAPFAPYLGAELWSRFAGEGEVFEERWPRWEQEFLVADTITYVVQINGKIRERLDAARNLNREELIAAARAHGRIPELIGDREIRKVIVVPNKLVNIVV
jgi:leucyl-tRNA synthetase